MAETSPGFRKIISSSGINLLFRIFGLGTSFLSTLFITRMFGLGDFGNYSLIFTICQACSMIFGFGIPNAIIKIVGNDNLDSHKAKALLKKALRITFIASTLPVAVSYFGAGFFSETVFHKADLIPYFFIIAVTLPLSIAHELFLYFFIATEKFLKYNLFMFALPNILLLFFLWGAMKLGLGGPYTFLAFFLSTALVFIAECIVIFELRPKEEAFLISSRQILKISSPMMFSSLLLYLLNWTDILMLGPAVSEEQIGIYNIAYKVGSVGFLVIVSISTIITPKIADLYGKKALDEIRILVQSSTRLIILLTVPAIALLALLGNFILGIFSDQAILGFPTLLIILGGILISALCGNVDQVLNMTDNQKVLRNITFWCYFLNVALNFLLIPRFGINGAATASLVTNVVLNLVCVYYIRKRLGFFMFSFFK